MTSGYCDICDTDDVLIVDGVCKWCWAGHAEDMREAVGVEDGAGVELERCEAALARFEGL